MRTAHVVFCEDKTYLLWQVELFIHSIINRGGVSEQDIIILHADPAYHDQTVEYTRSPYLESLCKKHPASRFYGVQNFGRRNWYFRFNDDKTWHPKQYPGINKWTSLCEAANAGWFDDFDEVLLLEQDLWFSGPNPPLPTGNCVTDNWINDRFNALEVNDKTDDMNTPGFDLDDIMKLCNVSSKNRAKWKGGSIIFKFITNELRKSKFLNAVINYNQLLMTLGELALPQGARHETDMIAPSLAMAHAGMDCGITDNLKWRSDVWTWNQEHLKCSFNKFIYGETLPWVDIDKYKAELDDVPFQWIKDFISDIDVIGQYDMNRECGKIVKVPII